MLLMSKQKMTYPYCKRHLSSETSSWILLCSVWRPLLCEDHEELQRREVQKSFIYCNSRNSFLLLKEQLLHQPRFSLAGRWKLLASSWVVRIPFHPETQQDSAIVLLQGHKPVTRLTEEMASRNPLLPSSKRSKRTIFFPGVVDTTEQIGNHIWGSMSDVSLNSLSYRRLHRWRIWVLTHNSVIFITGGNVSHSAFAAAQIVFQQYVRAAHTIMTSTVQLCAFCFHLIPPCVLSSRNSRSAFTIPWLPARIKNQSSWEMLQLSKAERSLLSWRHCHTYCFSHTWHTSPSLQMQRYSRGSPECSENQPEECLLKWAPCKSNKLCFRVNFIPIRHKRKSTNHLRILLHVGMLWNQTGSLLNTVRNVKQLLLPYGLLKISVFKAWVAVRPIIRSNMQKAQKSHKRDSVQSVSKKTHSEEMTERSPQRKRKPRRPQRMLTVLEVVVLFQSPDTLRWWEMLCESMKGNSRRRQKAQTRIPFVCQSSGWESKPFISGEERGS